MYDRASMRATRDLATEALEGLSSFAWFAFLTVTDLLGHARRRHAPLHRDLIFEQTARVGVGSVPLVALVSLFLGVTTVLLVGYQLERLGAVEALPSFVGVAFTRELGALLT